MGTTENRAKLDQSLELIREEAKGDRGLLYELYGSSIQPLIAPLLDLLERSQDGNPELVELTVLSLVGEDGGRRAKELRENLAAESSAEPEAPAAALWRFEWDAGRMGTVESVFVATREEIDAALGRTVYFGEILGKHSEIEGILEEDDLQLISEDASQVAFFREHIGCTGHNPLDYLDEEEGEEGDSEDE